MLPRVDNNRKGWPWIVSCEERIDTVCDAAVWPKITIVTPSYNQGEFIEETIRSVLLQGYPNLEYIIIDGGSADSSVEIIKKYAPWLSYWVSEPDAGQAHAINKGFAKATGDIYAYLNSDDIYEKDILLDVQRRINLRAKSEHLVAYTGVDWSEGTVLARHEPRHEPNIYAWLTSDTSLYQPSTFWTASLYKKIGGFNEKLHFCFDKEFFFSAIFLHSAYEAIDDIVASRFRIHPKSKTSTLQSLNNEENKLIQSRFVKTPEIERKFNSAKRELKTNDFITRSYQSDSFLFPLRLLMKAVMTFPKIIFSRYFLGALRKVLRG